MYSGDHVKKVDTYNHNILINPSFTVFQRAGTTDSGDWGVDHRDGDSAFGPDRWKFRGLDAVKGTMVQSSTAIDSGTNKLVVKHSNAESDAYTYQFIEAVNLQGLYGKEMTFSFSYSDVGGSGIPLVRIRSYDSLQVATDLFKAVPTSLGDNRWACTVTLSTSDGTIPDPSEKGFQVLIYANEQNTAPSEWSVWETKLEAGSVATPFIARSYGEELALCQRYYQTLISERNPMVPSGLGGQTSSGSLMLMSEMRAAPECKFVSPLTLYVNGASKETTSKVFVQISTKQLSYQAVSTSTYADSVCVHKIELSMDADF
jgi:hypothetical protein